MVAHMQGIPVRVTPPSMRHAGVRNDWPMGILPPVYKLTIVWPDGRQTTEVTSDRYAAESRLRYLSQEVDRWMVAFRGGHHDLFCAPCGTWHRSQAVEVDGTYEPEVRLVGGGFHFIEGLDANSVLSKWWGRPPYRY